MPARREARISKRASQAFALKIPFAFLRSMVELPLVDRHPLCTHYRCWPISNVSPGQRFLEKPLSGCIE
jgi:hypothetical protein